jgi:hypothetical protein
MDLPLISCANSRELVTPGVSLLVLEPGLSEPASVRVQPLAPEQDEPQASVLAPLLEPRAQQELASVPELHVPPDAGPVPGALQEPSSALAQHVPPVPDALPELHVPSDAGPVPDAPPELPSALAPDVRPIVALVQHAPPCEAPHVPPVPDAPPELPSALAPDVRPAVALVQHAPPCEAPHVPPVPDALPGPPSALARDVRPAVALVQHAPPCEAPHVPPVPDASPAPSLLAQPGSAQLGSFPDVPRPVHCSLRERCSLAANSPRGFAPRQRAPRWLSDGSLPLPRARPRAPSPLPAARRGSPRNALPDCSALRSSPASAFPSPGSGARSSRAALPVSAAVSRRPAR